MSDWIHCNSCYTRYKSSIKFNFTNCGHILCEKCFLAMGKHPCPICNTNCECIPISNLDQQLQNFFKPLPDLLEKSKQISNFQYSNTTSLLKQLTKKYNYAKTEVLKVYNANKELKKENEALKLQLSRQSVTSQRSGDSDFFSIDGSYGTTISNTYRRPQQSSLWNKYGEGRPTMETISSFEPHNDSVLYPPHGSRSSSLHHPSIRRVGPSPRLPMSPFHLGSDNPAQKYKR